MIDAKTIKPVVLYARFSSHAQNEQSIEGQLIECRNFAERNGYRIIEEYIDRALTGTTDKRPAFLRMIDDSKKRLFNYIIVYQLDRFARNRYDSALYKAKLKKNDVRVLSAKENITDDASGILIEGVLESMAEYYSVELAQKVVRGQRLSAEKCKYLGGGLAFGYMVNNATKLYEIDPITSPLVVSMFEQYAKGASLTAIAKYMCENQIKRKFTKTSVQFMLSNKKYIGVYKYNDIEIEGGIPTIIDNALFESVQRRLNMKSTTMQNNESCYMLTGKLYCGLCGSNMIGESGTSRNGTVHHYYKCANKKKQPTSCVLRAIKKDTIESIVVDRIQLMINNKEELRTISLLLEECNKSEELDGLIVSAKNELSACTKSIRNITNAIEQGIITPSTKERLFSLEQEREDIEYRIGCLSEMNVKLDAHKIEYWFTTMLNAAKTSEQSMELIINTFVKRLTLYTDRLIIAFNHADNPYTCDISTDDIEEIYTQECACNEKEQKKDLVDQNGSTRYGVAPHIKSVLNHIYGVFTLRIF